MTTTDGNEITEAIEQLRTQLAEAQEYGKDARLQFHIAEVEMEFLVEVRKDAGGSGGVRLGVVKLGADAKVSQGTTHRLRLKLDVRDTLTGDSATVSGRR
ncbi:trypco2 family protein [Streptomyces sp. NPDC047737]|uniref:trypco2 family protein n=1 Tax=unclassified Streptomyces TaxID=2593676 RepID=UPI0033B72042